MTRIVNVNNGTFQKDFTDGLEKYRETLFSKNYQNYRHINFFHSHI